MRNGGSGWVMEVWIEVVVVAVMVMVLFGNAVEVLGRGARCCENIG